MKRIFSVLLVSVVATGFSGCPVPQKSIPLLYNGGDCISHSSNTVHFNMHYVPAGGTLVMSELEEGEPSQTITISKAFWMGETEVTQGLWEDVWGSNWPGKNPKDSNLGKGLDYPAYYVNWYEVVAFCNLLTLSDIRIADSEQVYYSDPDLTSAYTVANAGRNDFVYWDFNRTGFRLPSEAEWEYAARYIDGTRWNDGDHVSGGPIYSDEIAPDEIGDYAWYSGNNPLSSTDSNYGSKAVGQKMANILGLFDMSGNVFEWCHDWYGPYSGEDEIDPFGPNTGSFRIVRGGDWLNDGYYLACSYRYAVVQTGRFRSVGFRLCRNAD